MYKSGGKWIFLFSILIIIVSGCNDEKENPPPKNLIPEDTYIDLLVQLQLINSIRQVSPIKPVNIDSLKQQVYDKYGVTEQQFIISHEYYQRQIKPQKQRISEAIDSLKQQMVKEGIDSVTSAP